MKKKVFIISTIILILLICSVIGIFIFIKQRDDKISLVKESVIIEYGETYNPNIEELIDLAKFDFIDTQKVSIDSNIKNEDNKEYPAIGLYEIIVKYKNRVLLQKVEVKDTISPELTIQESIEIPNGTELSTYDFSEFISISDLSEVRDYDIDFSNVNSAESGEYSAKISVQDIYSNKTEKEFKIVIPEVKVESVEESTNNEQVNVSNTFIATKNSNTSSSTNNNKTQTNTSNDATTNSQSTNSSPVVQNNNEHIEEPIEQPIEQETVRCTNNNNHAIGVGNSGQWFNSKNDAIAYYKSKVSYWSNLWEKFEIDDDTYYKNCPSGYEVWNCMYCSKWTINFYYR